MSNKQERIGEMIILGEVALFGLFPIIVNHSVEFIPPLLFASLTLMLAALCFTIAMAVTGNFKQLKDTKAVGYALAVTLLIVIIPDSLIFTGTQYTSGANTALLMQSEIPLTFLIYSVIFKEKIKAKEWLAGSFILMGTLLVLYNGSLHLNIGDLMIMAATVFLPFGNRFAKKAFERVSPLTVLFIRTTVGATVLLILSLITENTAGQILTIAQKNPLPILANGLLIAVASKYIWYLGFKRLPVHKAIGIGLTFPAFSLIYSIILLNEIPTRYQILGLIPIFIGIYFMTQSKKSKAELTEVGV